MNSILLRLNTLLLLVCALGLLALVDASTDKQYKFKSYSPDLDEWGSVINVQEIQGITHSDDFWYITTNHTIYKTLKDDITRVVAQLQITQLQDQLKGGYYNHFGDMSFHNGKIYIATTGVRFNYSIRRAIPIVVVLNADLTFVKYGRFPRDKQKGAGWVAINPVNGHLYSSNPYRTLHEYSIDFKNGQYLDHIKQYELQFKHGPKREKDWQGIPAQGGVFSESGMLYYVLDHKYKENAAFTGIHEFAINSNSNEASATDLFIPIQYKPNQGKKRLWELEGLTIINHGEHESLYHLELYNKKTDKARLSVYAIKSTFLKNQSKQ